MSGNSVFSEEWRDCLRAQYRYVAQHNDRLTLASLTAVMHEVGFSDDELRELYLQATMRADGVSADFLPDSRLFMETTTEAPVASPPPDVQPPDETVGEDEDEADEDAPHVPPDSPAQLTLF